MAQLSRKPKQRRATLSGLRPVATASDLPALARRRFLASERLSLEELSARARHLSRDRLSLGRERGASGRGGDRVDRRRHAPALACGRHAAAAPTRVVDALARGMRYIANSAPYRGFLERDPQKALRIVASKEAPVQARTIALNQRLLEEEIRERRAASAGRCAHDGLRPGSDRVSRSCTRT